MTIRISEGDSLPVDLLAATEGYYREIAEELVRAVEDVRGGKVSEVKAAQQAVKDLRALFQMVMEERTKVERLRKQAAGTVHGHAIDFDSARDEIGRRLARLRDAGGD